MLKLHFYLFYLIFYISSDIIFGFILVIGSVFSVVFCGLCVMFCHVLFCLSCLCPTPLFHLTHLLSFINLLICCTIYFLVCAVLCQIVVCVWAYNIQLVFLSGVQSCFCLVLFLFFLLATGFSAFHAFLFLSTPAWLSLPNLNCLESWGYLLLTWFC